jgi:nicotinamide riboside kinase
MSAAWTIEDSDGHLLPDFACRSRLEVGLKIVPTRFDAFRLQVSSSYRETFDRALRQVLQRQGWQIVQVGGAGKRTRWPG